MFRNIIAQILRVLRGFVHVMFRDFQVKLCKTHVFLKDPLKSWNRLSKKRQKHTVFT